MESKIKIPKLETLTNPDWNKHIVRPDETVLVTGANGFIGSKVVSTLLSYGFKRIRCFTRSTSNSARLEAVARQFTHADLDIVKGNLLSQESCRIAVEGVPIIYHLAAGVEKSFPGCFLNSVVTTRNLLDAAVKENKLKRFVNISSIAVYSNEKIARRGLLDESCQVDNKLVERHEPYTYGKAKQDEIVLEYAQKYDLPYVIVRPSVVFGPGKAKITDRIGTATFGIFLHLGLSNRIPLTYVDNCAEAIVLAGLRKGIDGHVINVFDDDLPKSNEFLRMYKQQVQRFMSIPVPYPVWFAFCCLWEKYSKWSEGQLPPVFNQRMCAVYWKGNKYSNKKTKELLEWNPKVSMKEALQSYFAYVRKAKGIDD